MRRITCGILKIIQNAKKPTVGHCMGEMGFPSRVLSLKYDALFTYAAFNKERGIAPGLPSMDELRKHYHVDSIDRDTQVFGVIGDPVAQSLSPLLHNQMFRRNNINAVYLPFRVPARRIVADAPTIRGGPGQGIQRDDPAQRRGAAAAGEGNRQPRRETGAANTLVKRDGGYHAWNTDYQAALESIQSHLPTNEEGERRELSECHALILGAGGAARAVAACLAPPRCDRPDQQSDPRTAQTLAKEVSGKAFDWEARNSINCDIIVNCTPIGMHPNVDESPIHSGSLKPGMLVFDTVYNPESTMLDQGRERTRLPGRHRR